MNRRTRRNTVNVPEEDVGSGSPEEVHARAWLAAHARDIEVAGASLPRDHYRNPDTGETVEHEQSSWLTAGAARRHGSEKLRSTEGHRGVLSYSALKTDLTEDTGFTALVGRGPRTRREMDVRVRLDRAIARLREDQQELLRLRFFEQRTLESLAEEEGVRLYAIQKRLANAIQDLYVAIAETWSLPYDPAEELLGIRVREGRPARDREGERRAAELVFVASRKEDHDEDAA